MVWGFVVNLDRISYSQHLVTKSVGQRHPWTLIINGYNLVESNLYVDIFLIQYNRNCLVLLFFVVSVRSHY